MRAELKCIVKEYRDLHYRPTSAWNTPEIPRGSRPRKTWPFKAPNIQRNPHLAQLLLHTATIRRVFSSVEVFMVRWKRTPFTAGYPAASSNCIASPDRDRMAVHRRCMPNSAAAECCAAGRACPATGIRSCGCRSSAYAIACRTRASFRIGSRKLNARYASRVPSPRSIARFGSRCSVITVSGEYAH